MTEYIKLNMNLKMNFEFEYLPFIPSQGPPRKPPTRPFCATSTHEAHLDAKNTKGKQRFQKIRPRWAQLGFEGG